MMLLIDAGNTRIKWQLRNVNGTVLASAAINHDQLASLGEILPQLQPTTAIHASNVAGPVIGERIRQLLDGRQIHWLQSGPECCGVRNLYAPGQLGADRWAALIGAHALHPGPCLVVMAGTATTIDLLSAAGEFLGGLILPGSALMQQALTQGTAQLPLAEGRFNTQPRRTVDAIHSGCIQAQAGAIERMFAQLADHPDTICLLGGGGADGLLPALTPSLGAALRRVDNLVLDGLAAIASAHDRHPDHHCHP
ncbi:MAG: type III pantothenate kinase [Thauera sp.]|jgi:type III pantothenate kinase|nr:type III pantothenate kinase [Thauera sp.]